VELQVGHKDAAVEHLGAGGGGGGDAEAMDVEVEVEVFQLRSWA
jgi:hypothetical protein